MCAFRLALRMRCIFFLAEVTDADMHEIDGVVVALSSRLWRVWMCRVDVRVSVRAAGMQCARSGACEGERCAISV